MQTRIAPAPSSRLRGSFLAVAVAVLLLSACAGQAPIPPSTTSDPSSRPGPAPMPQTQPNTPPLRTPIQRAPIAAPAPRQQTPIQRTHPRYAPPPGAPSHWSAPLGVYVVDDRELYYRERLFYRWDGDWYCSGRADGPWERVAPDAVPPGLRNRAR